MRRTLARELPVQEPGSVVTIQGWVHRRRSLAAVTFVVVRDRTGLAQVVVKDATTRAQVAEYGEETVVAVTGTVTANPSAPGGVEVTGPSFEALSAPSCSFTGHAIDPAHDDDGRCVRASSVALACARAGVLEWAHDDR